MNSKVFRYIMVTFAVFLFFAVGCERDADTDGKKKSVAGDSKKSELAKSEEQILADSLADAVNTESNDFAPIISADGNRLYFTSDRPGGKGGQDVWFSHKKGSRWSKAINFKALNTEKDEGIDTFSQDGKTVYFTGTDRPGGLGKADIYVCRRANSDWSKPQNPGAPLNSPDNDANASLSVDGRKLFFVSDRPGGMGGYDIWISELGPEGKWGEPVNPGENVNTDGWEGNVFIAPDGDTLYFSSNGHGGFGGTDVFKSIYREGVWSKAENLGDTINTTGNETYFTLPGSGDLAYMAVSLAGGKGGADIVAVPMPMVFSPKKIVVVAGTVTDTRTGAPARAYVKVKYRPTRRDISTAETREDGRFKLAFAPLKELMLMVYTDDKSVYPYYKSIDVSMDKYSQVILRNIIINSEAKLVEKPAER